MMTTRHPTILDPTGAADRPSDTTLTPRLTSLRGRTVGLVDNGKPNAALLLRELGQHLEEQHGVADRLLVTKGYFGTPADDEVVAQVSSGCDLAIAAVGD
jgi:hypothetical protein